MRIVNVFFLFSLCHVKGLGQKTGMHSFHYNPKLLSAGSETALISCKYLLNVCGCFDYS